MMKNFLFTIAAIAALAISAICIKTVGKNSTEETPYYCKEVSMKDPQGTLSVLSIDDKKTLFTPWGVRIEELIPYSSNMEELVGELEAYSQDVQVIVCFH